MLQQICLTQSKSPLNIPSDDLSMQIEQPQTTEVVDEVKKMVEYEIVPEIE